MLSLYSANQPISTGVTRTLPSSSPQTSQTLICLPFPKPCSPSAQWPTSFEYWLNLKFFPEPNLSSSNRELTPATSQSSSRWVTAVICTDVALIWVPVQRSTSASAKRDFADRLAHRPTPLVSNAHLQRSDACGGSRWLACSAPQFLVASYWPRPVGRAGLAAPSVIAFTNKSQWEGLLAHLWNVDSRTYQTS